MSVTHSSALCGTQKALLLSAGATTQPSGRPQQALWRLTFRQSALGQPAGAQAAVDATHPFEREVANIRRSPSA
jgi:hypothetical protein